jgi:dienelactone hydrolase
MDLSGNGPDGKHLEDGAPDQSDATKFRNFTDAETKDMWSYHAVAAVIRGHSLLASLPEVDPNRIAVTGISWGGYLTCIVAGLDHRLKAAVPVYGCGFLGDNSVWKDRSLAAMTPEARALWLKTFDPSQYLSNVRCPILFLNGSHDFAYPLDSYQKSYRLVKPSLRHLSIVMKLPHGHIWTNPEVDQFIDRALAHQPFAKITSLKLTGRTVRIHSTEALRNIDLNFSPDTGPWQQRQWQYVPMTISHHDPHAKIPPGPLTYFVTATTQDGLRISSEYFEAR